jgi:hypothetical protein
MRSLFLIVDRLAVDPSQKRGRRLEGQNLARGDRSLRSRLGIAPNALALRADVEFAEGPHFHGLVPYKRLTNLLEKVFEHRSGLRARQARGAGADGFLQCGSRQGARIPAFSSHVVHGNLLVQPGVTRKEAAAKASGPSLGGVPKEEEDTAAGLLGWI